MKLTIGMAVYKNFEQVWFTLQALRMYQNIADIELIVIDNFGDDSLRDFIRDWMTNGIMPVRYVRYTVVQGPANAKNRIFVESTGEWVLVIDSHVMLAPGAVQKLKNWIDRNPHCRDLLHGPLLYDDLHTTADAMNNEWRGGMWGTWRNAVVDTAAEPYSIPMHGMGLFACRRDAWLGFNPDFRGFGGEEGYIHTKFRQAGRDILLLPFLRWCHYFQTRNGIVSAPYIPMLADKIRNYKIGFQELGLDTSNLEYNLCS